MEKFYEVLIAAEGRFPEKYRTCLHNLFCTAYRLRDEKVVRVNVEAFSDYRYLVHKEKLRGIALASKLADNGYEHEFTVTLKPKILLAELNKYSEVLGYAA